MKTKTITYSNAHGIERDLFIEYIDEKPEPDCGFNGFIEIQSVWFDNIDITNKLSQNFIKRS